MALGNGFTVDDALISTRVAHQIWSNGHYRFNPEGPAVDCVTPLGWAWLLAPFGSGGPWGAFQVARAIGVSSALSSAWLLGELIRSRARGMVGTTRRRDAALDYPRPERPASDTCLRGAIPVLLLSAVLATSLPFGAWASSGMETSVVMLLCTVAVWGFASRRWLGPIAAAVGAAWRPELAPWAIVMAWSSDGPPTPHAPDRRRTTLGRLVRVLVVATPILFVMTLRYVSFGAPVPLAVAAKPSDGAHGWMYTWGALRFLGFPILLLGRRAFTKLPPIGVAMALAFGAHILAVVGVGGDWMSLFRLFVPLIPASLWLCHLVLREQSTVLVVSKGLVAVAANGFLLYSVGPTARQVLQARQQLISLVSPQLAPATNVGALDVGWVGVATSAPITDLAGVTDPEVAHLPGGHTSKRLPTNFLVRRHVDALVLLLAPNHPAVEVGTPLHALRFARAVESSLLRQDDSDLFVVSSVFPLLGTTQRYVVLQRRLEPRPD